MEHMTQLLSPRDLAQKLSLKEQTIYNRHSNGGNLPLCLKIGNRLRFRQSDVDAWIVGQIKAESQSMTLAHATPVPEKRRPGRPTKTEQIVRRNNTTKA